MFHLHNFTVMFSAFSMGLGQAGPRARSRQSSLGCQFPGGLEAAPGSGHCPLGAPRTHCSHASQPWGLNSGPLKFVCKGFLHCTFEFFCIYIKWCLISFYSQVTNKVLVTSFPDRCILCVTEGSCWAANRTDSTKQNSKGLPHFHCQRSRLQSWAEPQMIA